MNAMATKYLTCLIDGFLALLGYRLTFKRKMLST